MLGLLQADRRYGSGSARDGGLKDAIDGYLVQSPEAWPAWLGEQPADERHLKALLAPYPSDDMICWPVSPRVGNVKNNDSTLIEPLAAA